MTSRPNVTIIHPESKLFDEKGRVKVINNNNLLYRDDDHLSSDGTYFVAPVFEDLFRNMAIIH